ncbi:MAG TPA: endonuclease VIII [Oscillospiraceae bacterium]|nr:endonuclease VIII [Oscillospiraceae bacterium]HPF55603.1 endonuclease VIII [Clostridiales bacterium]HPK34616.1 endonuclease VIII [Oscillospiraceae bacterium]HPR74619.1 endonuclease VIII [Oscillospiraceae bacterium]
MIELPEAYVLANQLNQAFLGKTIVSAAANTSPHSFAWYSGDPALYNEKLAGKKITGTAAYGGRPEMYADDMVISFSDGVRALRLTAEEKRPDKHQLLLEFDDGSALCCTVQMYGGMMAFPNEPNNDFYYNVAKEKPSPFSEAFDMAYFDGLFEGIKTSLSVKALLATEQRIPGLGNGVLQDILFNARIHPKRKAQSLSDDERDVLYNAVVSTLKEMRDGGGRDTERDLFGKPGGYNTILSNKTVAYPCRVCGSGLKREAYMGGNIYYCPGCQKI